MCLGPLWSVAVISHTEQRTGYFVQTQSINRKSADYIGLIKIINHQKLTAGNPGYSMFFGSLLKCVSAPRNYVQKTQKNTLIPHKDN